LWGGGHSQRRGYLLLRRGSDRKKGKRSTMQRESLHLRVRKMNRPLILRKKAYPTDHTGLKGSIAGAGKSGGKAVIGNFQHAVLIIRGPLKFSQGRRSEEDGGRSNAAGFGITWGSRGYTKSHTSRASVRGDRRGERQGERQLRCGDRNCLAIVLTCIPRVIFWGVAFSLELLREMNMRKV